MFKLVVKSRDTGHPKLSGSGREAPPFSALLVPPAGKRAPLQRAIRTFKGEFAMQVARVLSAIAVAAFAIPGAAGAQTPPKEGAYDFTACWSGTNSVVSFSKTHSAFSLEMTGSTRSNPPGGMFDNHTFRCVGAQASLGGKNSGITVCEAVDKDGDKRLSYFSIASDGSAIREANVQGTGKYEGMEMRGTVKPLGPFPTVKPGTFQNCNHQTGTYKLK